jgi:hypothetical protein
MQLYQGFVKICEDLLDSWKHIESLKIGWICDSRFETNLFYPRFVIHNTIQIPDSYRKAQIEPFSWYLGIY